MNARVRIGIQGLSAEVYRSAGQQSTSHCAPVSTCTVV
jgi:hypothetical protein